MLLLFFSGAGGNAGIAAGAATVLGVGQWTVAATFTASGLSEALGETRAFNAATGTADGLATALGGGGMSMVFGITGVQALGVVGGAIVWGKIMTDWAQFPDPPSDIWTEIVPKNLW